MVSARPDPVQAAVAVGLCEWRDPARNHSIANVDRIYGQGNERLFACDCFLSGCLLLAANFEGRLATILSCLWARPFAQ
jgi:hypothetical protein